MAFPARMPALAALAIPALAGIAWLAASEAPRSYPLVNAAALMLASLWIVFGRTPRSLAAIRVLVVLLLAILFLPQLTGPQISGIARWIPLGPVTLHAGSLAVPALVVLAARDAANAALVLAVALFAALLQPDAATGFALLFGAVAIHHVGRDWKVGVVCIVGFLASIHMAIKGQLPAQPFVERVLVTLATEAPWWAIGLSAALLAAFLLMLRAPGLAAAERFALAGALFGFSLMAWLSNYPSVLIGYGASPILGFGLALGLQSGRRPLERPADRV